MYMKKRVFAALCAALTMSGVYSLSAFADETDADTTCSLSSAAYQMLLDYYGCSPAELDAKLSVRTAVNTYDFVCHVNCPYARATPATVKIDITYNNNYISYFDVINGSITANSTGGGYTTAHTQTTFNQAGRIMTYRFTRTDLSTDPSTFMPTSYCADVTYLKFGNYTPETNPDSWITYDNYVFVGDLNNDGAVDISDYMAICNYLVGSGSPSINRAAIDVNSDGYEDLTDANLIYDYICHVNTHVWG